MIKIGQEEFDYITDGVEDICSHFGVPACPVRRGIGPKFETRSFFSLRHGILISAFTGHRIDDVITHEVAHYLHYKQDTVKWITSGGRYAHGRDYFEVLVKVLTYWHGTAKAHDWSKEYRCLQTMAYKEGLTGDYVPARWRLVSTNFTVGDTVQFYSPRTGVILYGTVKTAKEGCRLSVVTEDGKYKYYVPRTNAVRVA